MRSEFTTFFAVIALIAPLASADLHSDAVCFDGVGGQNVYNEAATNAACTSYFRRNTGNEQWDICPDCIMVSVLAKFVIEHQG
jgi:hypothetical protein